MHKPTRRNLAIIALVAILSTTSYLLASYIYFRVGYPLDDAWIYQTYARNLVHLGEWSFIPGQESGGSTGPLWVLFVSIGYFFRIDHIFWTFFFGTIILVAVGILGACGFEVLQPNYKKWSLVAGLVLVLEWHLIWAALSGMETLLFAFVILLSLLWLLKPSKRQLEWLFLGLLIGLSVWIRPDGITLLGPAGLVILAGTQDPLKQKVKNGFILGFGFVAIFGLYLAFNQFTAGTIWPNTFYAKQAEYAELQGTPIILRYLQQITATLPGIGIALLPGFIITVYRAVREKSWALIASALWFLGYLAIYAIRLPVTYQHGRYILPAMPVFFLLGIAGAVSWIIEYHQDKRMIVRVISKAWMISGLCILGLFWFLGARAYARDTAIIESEMVTAAQWIEENTEPDALIAAHDIGALGYFGGRDLVDLAGLISPDVIPFIRDETRLASYLDTQEVRYLMTFPEWYPELTAHAVLVYQTQGPYSPKLGGENMAVYRWSTDNNK